MIRGRFMWSTRARDVADVLFVPEGEATMTVVASELDFEDARDLAGGLNLELDRTKRRLDNGNGDDDR